ncbi:hypothetical protein OOU_Y34scaffold00594g13 [Pyricularia oryzae Y34]|uniref:Uncharacterized protein n=2 Tax=Pyricularia oryzae TaxID=318829 RepID=A0AA97PK30_PYRO3|nr:hypothetical protein OOU_Y34scaffold00594g13 [Pyricularia oryzae Y34]
MDEEPTAKEYPSEVSGRRLAAQ